MEAINELELRNLLKQKLPAPELLKNIIKSLLDPHLAWEEKRPFFVYLYANGKAQTLAHACRQVLESKSRIPYDLLLDMFTEARLEPRPVVIESLLKGLKKQSAQEDIFASRGWDRFDKRLTELRNHLLETKVKAQREFRDNLVEKFWFLRNQRMTDQAGRVLRRMLELYPGDAEFQKIKQDYDDQWARDVLQTHMSKLSDEKMERTRTAPSGPDQEMLRIFQEEGEKLCLGNREVAPALAFAFLFMDEPGKAAEILAWGPVSTSNDWLRAELLVAARRFVEGLELLNQLEVKYIDDPETTFAVSYLRAQCLHHLGQHASALEILQSIVRVRPGYRSAHALILEWTAGVSWE